MTDTPPSTSQRETFLDLVQRIGLPKQPNSWKTKEYVGIIDSRNIIRSFNPKVRNDENRHLTEDFFNQEKAQRNHEIYYVDCEQATIDGKEVPSKMMIIRRADEDNTRARLTVFFESEQDESQGKCYSVLVNFTADFPWEIDSKPLSDGTYQKYNPTFTLGVKTYTIENARTTGNLVYEKRSRKPNSNIASPECLYWCVPGTQQTPRTLGQMTLTRSKSFSRPTVYESSQGQWRTDG